MGAKPEVQEPDEGGQPECQAGDGAVAVDRHTVSVAEAVAQPVWASTRSGPERHHQRLGSRS